ncbi:hypothetical protein C2S51_003552 [Perilla frutescens var. frutescens]|nr:hypothetical protein C2S51_003552 [Perilla frutescens var. frutescens]
MIQTINPYATARTAEIMSRYRPIAPKPEPPATNSAADNDSSAVPTGIRKSPYLRNVWAHLQARPTRTRKRGRTAAFSPPSSVKRTRTTCLQGLSPPPPYQLANSSAAMHGFTRNNPNGLQQISIAPNLVQLKCGLDSAVTTLAESVALPLLYCTAAAASQQAVVAKGIDLNMTADQGQEELDLHLHLHEPVKPCVISPRPVRPVGSSIIVKSITDDPLRQTMAKGPEEVEEVVDAEAVPAIVSDSNNKVRMSNAAYKEMVGQPECCWLDCATEKRCRGGGGGVCKRIGGEVSLQFVDSEVRRSMAAFTCAVKIEWECEGKKMCVNANCSAVKLVCESKDYQFLWRFNTVDEEASKSAN